MPAPYWSVCPSPSLSSVSAWAAARKSAHVQSSAAAVAVLAFVAYWGDYLSPLLYLSDARRYTLPVALQLLQQLGRSDYPLLMAGAAWATAAPLVLVVAAVTALALAERRARQPGAAKRYRQGANGQKHS